MATNGPCARGDVSWMTRAASSLPEPGAPVIMTREFVGPTRSITCRNWLSIGDLPTMRFVAPARARRSVTSRFSREASSARSATSTSRSALNGFSMKS